MKVLILLHKIVAFWYCTQFGIINCLLCLKNFSLIIEEIDFKKFEKIKKFRRKFKKSIQSSQLTELFSQNLGNIEE